MTEFSTPRSDKRKSVFISYAQADRAVAERLVERLKSGGIDTCSFADVTPGEDFQSFFNARLRSSDYFIALFSRSSLRSTYFIEEVLHVDRVRELSDRSISVIPILLDDVEMPAAFRSMMPLDFRSDREAGMQALSAVLAPTVDIDFSTMTPRQFEELVADLLTGFGYHIQRHVIYQGRGFDFRLSVSLSDPFGLPFTESWLVEVKHKREGRLGTALIAEFAQLALNTADRNTRIVLVTSGQVTSAAREIVQRAPLHLIEGVDLKRTLLARPELVRAHFGSRNHT